jgi:hypothetical protein
MLHCRGEGGLQEGVGALGEGVVDVYGHVVEAREPGSCKAPVAVHDDESGASQVRLAGVRVEERHPGDDGQGLDHSARRQAVREVFDGAELHAGVVRVVRQGVYGDPPGLLTADGRLGVLS